MYPVLLGIRSQPCLVVGGGSIAARKVEGLLAESARVTVVAPRVAPTLEELASSDKICWLRRPYEAGEASQYALVIAATDDRDVNRDVFKDAQAAKVWVNVVDDPELCTFHLPARIQRGGFQMTVASDGKAPFAVGRMRRLLEEKFGHEWAEWMDAAARFRTSVRQQGLSQAEQEQRFDRFFAATVDHETLHARVPTRAEENDWLAGRSDGGEPTEDAPALPHDQPWESRDAIAAQPGLVSLVGAGPGDPGLLTIRAVRRLERADVIVYDRLAATSIPCNTAPDVEMHGVGKQAGNHPVPQEEINALLVRLARQGKRVVRLKGGDPYVFGRGGEEAEALREARVPFEVVPCVTAGVAVPTYAGIPVTQRREAVRVTLVTAHEAIKSKGPQVRWDMLASDPHATIVGYMGLTSMTEVADQLLGSGMDPDCPAAMIERGTTSRQRTVISTISKIPDDIRRAKLRPPALFVIGPTIRHAERLNWFTSRPLFGQRIGVFSTAGDWLEALDLAGAEVLEVPLPVSPAARIVMEAAPLSGWVLQNAEQVEALEEERHSQAWHPDIVGWCLHSSAYQRAQTLGWRAVHCLRPNPTPEDLVAALAKPIA